MSTTTESTIQQQTEPVQHMTPKKASHRVAVGHATPPVFVHCGTATVRIGLPPDLYDAHEASGGTGAKMK